MIEIINAAVNWARETAANPAHGYSQEHRWGPDYDCSSFVISAWRAAGIELACTYTGDMRDNMLHCGFIDVTESVNLSDGSGLEKGDVLLNEKSHAAIYTGASRIVQASINERVTVRGGESGDQTGREIYEREYYNYPWDCVLRYAENPDGISPYWPLRELEYDGEKMPVGPDVAAVQALLRCRGIMPALDGEYGPETRRCVLEFQRRCGLPENGRTDLQTRRALLAENNNYGSEG